MTDKLDAATIRELLALCERVQSTAATKEDWDDYELELCPIRCAAMLTQLQSQAAELEELREWKCQFCSCQFSVSYASGSIYCPSCMTLAGVAETFSIPMPIKEQP